MSLVEHKFEESSHTYRVPGERVLATSDVIFLNGLYDIGQVPISNLEFAGHRGHALHLAIRAYETGVDVEDRIREYEKEVIFDRGLMDTVLERMNGYYRFRDKHDLMLLGDDDALAPDEMEVSRVYQHQTTGVLIGATPDLPCYVDGKFTIVDVKSSFRNTGKKAMQDMFKWRLQLQSYLEAIKEDEELWKKYKRPHRMKKAILHLHPECQPRGAGFEYHVIPANDDKKAWHAAVVMANEKLNNGFKLDERRAA